MHPSKARRSSDARVGDLPGVRDVAIGGLFNGASRRHRAGYRHAVELPVDFAAGDQALLTDPQTRSGLLVR